MDNRRVLKSITTDVITGDGKGGRLNPEQADRFIDYVVSENQFLQAVRMVRMDGPEYDLDFIDVSNRLLRLGIEAQEPTFLAGVQTSKRRLQTVEGILAFDVSKHFLEDNIERAEAEDRIARMMATQYGNDLLDLAINGDRDASGADADFLTIDDGWIKKARTYPGVHKFDAQGSRDFKNVIFETMLRMLPRKWKANTSVLRFLVSANTAQDYVNQLQPRETGLGDRLIVTGEIPPFRGVALEVLPYWPDDVVMLTMPRNLAVGIQRDFTVDREWKPRRRVMEYTMTNRFDPAEIVVDDAVVIAFGATGEAGGPGGGDGSDD